MTKARIGNAEEALELVRVYAPPASLSRLVHPVLRWNAREDAHMCPRPRRPIKASLSSIGVRIGRELERASPRTNCALDCIGLGGRRESKRICTLSPRLSSVLITMNKKRRRWCDAAHRVRIARTGSEFECGRFHSTGVPPLAKRKKPCV